MGQVIIYLVELLGLTNTILSILGSIKALLTANLSPADQTTQFADVEGMYNTSVAVSATNEIILNLINTNQATLTSQLGDIEVAVAACQQAGLPVTLPSSAPSGYGGGSAGDIADAVWAKDVSGLGDQASALMTNAGIFAMYVGGSLAVPWGSDPKLLITGGAFWNPLNGPPSIPFTIRADERNILPGDTLITWLNRETGFTWTFDSSGYAVLSDFAAGTNAAFPVMCKWTPADFAAQQATVAPSKQPPVWIGVDNQTYHGLIPFSDSGVLTTHCHGVIVLVTAVPTKQGKFTFGTFTSWRNIGSIAFVTDDGEAEPFQLLSFDTAVYMCRQMVVAEQVAIHLEAGVSINVIPFTIDGT